MKPTSRSVTTRLFLILLITSLLLPINYTSAEQVSWDENWSYSQQITIPIDTSLEQSTHQPIDLFIEFDSACWAKNEQHHSIRVCTWHKNQWHELESQIYNLQTTDNNHISGCNIVFLIPSFADGSEEYYVYYDDVEKPIPQYTDHVSISESYYHYEPISGYPLESSYYKITDDGIIPYIVSQKGQFMGYNTGQHVTKMLADSTEVLPKNGDLFAAFDFKYCYDHGLFDYSSTSQKLLNKEVFVNGNLMVSFGMVSTSKFEDLKTTVRYTYYHCPTTTTRMRVHVKHETLTDVKTLLEADTDGVFASLQSGGVKSDSIEDLNIGSILPYMHFINEYNEISSYDLDKDPEYIPEDPDIRVVSHEDDVDLGNQPWISFNEGKQGLAHAVLFHSNQVLVSGTEEREGLQLNAFQMDYPHLPGLENNIATIQVGRNSYEPNTGHDISIPNNLVVEFDAEFFTTRSEGINGVKKEARIYNKIIDETDSVTDGYNDESEDSENYELTVNVHLTPTFPLGSALSAASGLNLSFITVELYEDDVYLSSGSAVRIPMNSLDQNTENMFEQIKELIGIIDYRNISLRKRVIFDSVKPGDYTVKLFLENAPFSSERKYLGFAEVDISEDTSINLRGGRQQSISLTVIDQNQKEVSNAEVRILKDSSIVSKGTTDENGVITLTVPNNADPYTLQVIIKGIICYNEPLNIRRIQLRDRYEEISIERYNIDILAEDEWSLPPGIDLTPILLNKEGESVGSAEQQSSGSYQFSSYPPEEYHVVIQYKSFSYKEEITLQEDTRVSVTFPAMYTADISILDTHGLSCQDTTLLVERDGKEKTYNDQSGSFQIEIPPGTYTTSVYQRDTLIGKRKLSVSTDSTQEYITNKEPIYPLIVYVSLIGIAGLLTYYLYKKNLLFEILQFLPILILLASIISPWWFIQGSTNSVETITHLFLLPAKLITVTSSSAFITGEQGYLPDLFITLIYAIISAIIVSSLLMILSFFIRNKKKKMNLLLRILTTVFLLGTIGIFIFGMSTLSEISVGTLFGEGMLNVSVSGQAEYTEIPCTWGPGFGFYLLIISTLLNGIILIKQWLERG